MDISERLRKAAVDFPVIEDRPDELFDAAHAEIEGLKKALKLQATQLEMYRERTSALVAENAALLDRLMASNAAFSGADRRPPATQG